MCYYCGASVYDVILIHGLGRHTIYNSIYGVTNARECAAGFRMKSAADFDTVCLAVDGMIVWTNQPTKEDFDDLNIGKRSFHCYRKD
ncbi:hypothetical protein ACHAW6_003846 [Cyclotella cf. meneghiniana]